MSPAGAPAAGLRAGTRWSLLLGNFAIGCGVMVVPGSLNDLARGLQVSVPAAGQLITVAAWAMALSAPLLATLLSRLDRRRLLTWVLLWYAAGHALSAAMPDLAALLPVRAATVLAAAVFTPAAAAVVGALAEPHQRGEAITFVFLGWSVASVLGMPAANLLAETVGWQGAFLAVAAVAGAAALATGWHTPAGLRPRTTTLRDLAGVLARRDLMAVVAVTALSATGQFVVFSYMAPYFVHVLRADAAQASLLFLWFGAFGVAGSVLMSRWIDRLGAGAAATVGLAATTVSLLAWPWAPGIAGMAVVLVPWALGCFSSQSAQQARLAAAAPALAAVLVSLNSSAMYVGQGIGAAGGGVLLAGLGYGALAPVAVAALTAATALSWWLARSRSGAAAHPLR
jgi:predicted MFS family arabinose efflux permease